MKNTIHAQQALDAYATREGSCSGSDPSRTGNYHADLVDLVADLLHLADELNTDHGYLGKGGEGAVESALNHYRAETNEGDDS